ncbi:hypothetical protein V9K92_10600 [Phyllobacterium sp. CCNWLW109]|uniref:hypothetical protein n=1 Tax=Phyllobacterium sp. CCNWLW109 TaxID=3127479 RepID=UPI0030770A91
MVDDMNNGNASRHYQDAMQAQIGERVTNLGRRQTDLESEMRSGFKQMETALSGLANETRSSLSALSTTIVERNKPQWQALGVALTFCTLLGGLAYWPINTATTDLKAAVLTISERMVSRQEMDWRQARGTEDRARMEASINALEADQVPRKEHERVWQSYDAQMMSDREARMAANQNLQRQIDEIKQTQSGFFGQRDLNMQVLDRLERIERDRRQAANP